MKNRTLLGGGALLVVLALAGCSPSPKVGDVDTDALIATCLNGASPAAQDSNTLVEGTVSAVNTEDGDDGVDVNIVFDARDENNTADPAQCTLTVAGEKVTEFDLGSPDSDSGTAVEGAMDRWNDKHAEDWAEGNGPDPVDAPDPGNSSSAEY